MLQIPSMLRFWFKTVNLYLVSKASVILVTLHRNINQIKNLKIIIYITKKALTVEQCTSNSLVRAAGKYALK